MRRHFLSILSIACLTIATSSYGQRMPIYSLFIHEPYLYNPAEVASDEFTSITGSHRQQWRGIEGAPIVSTLLFQTPFDYKKGAIGATVRNFERGLLSTIEALGTYGYTIYFTKTTTVHFGLSGGVTSTTLNIPADDAMNDPALLNALDYRMEPIANFGFKIRSKSGLNFGASLPTLFRPGFVGESHFDNISFSPFDNVTVMTYFRKKLEKKIVTRKRRGAYGRVAKKNEYAPLELYAIYNYGRFSDQRIELLAKLSIG